MKKISELNTAYFVKDPFRLEDLTRPHFMHQRKAFAVEATVELSPLEYKNFVTDLCADRPFIEKHMDISRVDYEGVWHCILVKRKSQPGGVLVMSEGHDYPKWAAYIQDETKPEKDKTEPPDDVIPPS